jgi:hypothetical protein
MSTSVIFAYFQQFIVGLVRVGVAPFGKRNENRNESLALDPPAEPCAACGIGLDSDEQVLL